MKKLLTTLALCAAGFGAAHAQSDKKLSFSVGADAALPLGTFGDLYKFGIGGTAKGALKVFDQGSVTLTAGYIHFLGKDIASGGPVSVSTESVGFIPVKAGFNYFFGPLYIEPQVGVGNFTKGGGAGFNYAGLVGVRFSALDISARYEGISKDGTSSFLGLRVAVGF